MIIVYGESSNRHLQTAHCQLQTVIHLNGHD